MSREVVDTIITLGRLPISEGELVVFEPVPILELLPEDRAPVFRGGACWSCRLAPAARTVGLCLRCHERIIRTIRRREAQRKVAA